MCTMELRRKESVEALAEHDFLGMRLSGMIRAVGVGHEEIIFFVHITILFREKDFYPCHHKVNSGGCIKTIGVFDEKNYDPDWTRYVREAVRAVIVRGDKIALVRSRSEGFYKFPGGGIEEGETHLDTLVRETAEEAGLEIVPETVREFGMLHEIRKGLYGEEIFDQRSYYYLVDVREGQNEQKLDEYEERLGYELVWENIQKAYDVNMELGKKYRTTFVIRESYVLERLLKT